MLDFTSAALLGPLLTTILALVGLVITLFNISEAMRDLMLGLTGIGGELIPIVAWNNVRNELLLATILSVYLIVGILAVITPPNPSPEATVGRILGVVLYLGTEMLIVVNSIANRRDRQLLRGPQTVSKRLDKLEQDARIPHLGK
ncbi:MAG TPA: hypothetical protein VEO01_37970 [Pseudonocardiaceae bacterium]|nr:hypothetical protein [Pseudonocardiaceae bacterium]